MTLTHAGQLRKIKAEAEHQAQDLKRQLKKAKTIATITLRYNLEAKAEIVSLQEQIDSKNSELHAGRLQNESSQDALKSEIGRLQDWINGEPTRTAARVEHSRRNAQNSIITIDLSGNSRTLGFKS
jgi:uncharacterized membrane protein